MNRLIIILCVLMEVAVIIAQKNDDLSSCQILDTHGKDYFCRYYCHNDTDIQAQKSGHPFSVSPENDKKTQTEITTKSTTALLQHSTISKSSTTNIGKNTSTYNMSKKNIKASYKSSTSPTVFKRFSTTSKSSTTTYNLNKEIAKPPPSTSSRPSVLSTVNSPLLSNYYLPSKSL